MFGLKLDTTGIEEARRAINLDAIYTAGAQFHEIAALDISIKQKVLAPQWRGNLTNSIEVVHHMPNNRWGRDMVTLIGPTVPYAKRMEYGTGSNYDGDGTPVPAYPTVTASLNEWAQDHGFDSGATVAYLIGSKGGLYPRRYVRQAFDSFVSGRLNGLWSMFVDGVVRALGGQA